MHVATELAVNLLLLLHHPQCTFLYYVFHGFLIQHAVAMTYHATAMNVTQHCHAFHSFNNSSPHEFIAFLSDEQHDWLLSNLSTLSPQLHP
jgi:hypothetical protein